MLKSALEFRRRHLLPREPSDEDDTSLRDPVLSRREVQREKVAFASFRTRRGRATHYQAPASVAEIIAAGVGANPLHQDPQIRLGTVLSLWPTDALSRSPQSLYNVRLVQDPGAAAGDGRQAWNPRVRARPYLTVRGVALPVHATESGPPAIVQGFAQCLVPPMTEIANLPGS